MNARLTFLLILCVLLLLLISGCIATASLTPTASTPAATAARSEATTAATEAVEPTAEATETATEPTAEATPVTTNAAAVTPQTASIQLPDGEQCLFAGTGGGIGADGKRLNYTCTDPKAPTTVLLGDPQPGANGTWSVTEGVIAPGDNGFSLQSQQQVSATIAVVALPDGTWCNNSGQGAVPAFDGKRLNYSCGLSETNQIGLIGDFQIGDNGAWMAEVGVITQTTAGFTLTSSSMVEVKPQQINLADGMQCQANGEGATLAFNGERVNYRCNDPNAPIVGLLGDITQIQETVWSTDKATLTHTSDGFVLQSSEIITYRIQNLDLVDGVKCAFAGEGATLAFNNQRLNYNCGDKGDTTQGILGDVMQGDAGIWTANDATIKHGDSGFTLDSSVPMTVAAIYGGDLTATGVATTTTSAVTATMESGTGITSSAESTATSSAGIANPASQYCVAQGGTLTIETGGDGGQFGVCSFEDNRQCEEWAMMRGECPVGGIKVTGYLTPAARFCAITGGDYTDNGTTSADNEQGVCTFSDGKACSAADYYNGMCTP